MSDRRLFAGFPEDAHVWIYVASEVIPSDTQEALLSSLRTFFPEWRSHGTRVVAAATVVADRFLVVSGYIEGGVVSGCGIDASSREVERIAGEHGIAWETPLGVYVQESGSPVRKLTRRAFRDLLGHSASQDILVYDPSVTRLGDLWEGAFARPAAQSWAASLQPTHPA